MKQQKQRTTLSKEDAINLYRTLKDGTLKLSFIKYTGNKETDDILTKIIRQAQKCTET